LPNFRNYIDCRPNNMVDVLSTRLQEVYAKWETRTEVMRNAQPPTTRFSLDGNGDLPPLFRISFYKLMYNYCTDVQLLEAIIIITHDDSYNC